MKQKKIEGGLVLGKVSSGKKEKVMLINDDVHSIIIGSTRCGKSRCLVLPSIGVLALSGESMVISDPKGELYLYTKPYLEKKGYKVIAIDFKNPEKSQRYNFLQPIIDSVNKGEINKAIERTWDLVTSLVPTNDKTERIWADGEMSILASTMMSVVYDNQDKPEFQNMSNVYAFIAEMCKVNEKGILPLSLYMDDIQKEHGANHPALLLSAISGIAPSKTRSSFYTSALTTLKLFTNPSINDMTSCSDFDLAQISKEKTAIFFILPDEKDTYYSLASLLINQIYTSLVEQADQRGGRLLNRVNFLLDEFGNFTKIPSFDSKLTVGGGRGIRFNLIVQGFSQLEEKYGRDIAKTIRGNCEYWIYLRTDDHETREEISKKLGNYTTSSYSISSSTQAYQKSSSSQSVNLMARPLLTPDEIGQIDRPHLLVMSRHRPAITTCPDLSQWYFNKAFGLGDKDHNTALKEKRQNERPSREVGQMVLWGIWNFYKQRAQQMGNLKRG